MTTMPHEEQVPRWLWQASALGLIVVLMLTGGEALEDYANARAHREVSALLERAPRFAHRADSTGGFVEVPISEVVVGDLVMVRPGEVVPVDGVLESEGASFDESSITGESLPVEHARGDQVLSGTVSQQKVALVRAGAQASSADVSPTANGGWAAGASPQN